MPLILPEPLCNRQSASPVVFVSRNGRSAVMANPVLVCAESDADVLPISAAVFVPQVVPTPSTSERLCTAAETIRIEQMCKRFVEVMRFVDAVWLSARTLGQTVLGFGDGATTSA